MARVDFEISNYRTSMTSYLVTLVMKARILKNNSPVIKMVH